MPGMNETPEFDLSSAVDEVAGALLESEGNEEETLESVIDDAVDTAAGGTQEAPETDPETTAESTSTETADPEKSDESGETGETADDDTPAVDAAPKTWRKEAQAEWDKLSPTVKAEIAKREADMYKGIEQYKNSAGLGEAFHNILKPYLPMLNYHQVDPGHHLQSLLQTAHNLATGTEAQKIEIIQTIAQQYGVDLSAVTDQVSAYVDPTVAALQREVQTLQSQRQQEEQARLTEYQTRIQSEINAFAADPKNIYFNELQDDMTRLIQAGYARNLAEAYTAAMKINPQVAAKETARLTAEKKAELAAKEAERVRKAAASTATNLQTSAKNGSPTAPVGSIDDTLIETLRNINNR